MKKMGTCNHQYDGEHTYTALCPTCQDELYGHIADLQGTDKQVTWADDIRQQMLKGLAANILKRGTIQQAHAQGKAVAHKLAQATQAEWWIASRALDTNSLLNAGLTL